MYKQEEQIAAGRAPSKEELNWLLLTLFERVSDECEDWLASRPPYLEARTYTSIDEFEADAERQLDDHLRPSNQKTYWQHQLECGDYSEAASRLKPILAEQGLHLDEGSNEFRRLAARGMRVGIEAYSRFDRSLNGDTLDDDLSAIVNGRSNSVATAPAEPITKAPAPLISTFKGKFVETAIREGQWKEQTRAQNENSIDLLIRIVGDKPAGSLTRSDAEKVRRTLEKIPSNYGKSPRHYTIPVEQVIAEKKPETKTLSVGTLDRHWHTIVSFVRFMNRQDGVPVTDMDRVFGGFRWSANVPDAEEREPWDAQSLEQLFGSPIWTGFAINPGKRYWRHKPGQVIVKDEYWWLPLLALYQGARAEELCRLTGRDVYLHPDHDFPVIDIRGPHLKTKGSARVVPVHSAMVRLGLLSLAKKAGDGPLFPMMQEGGRDKKLSYHYTQHFTQYRREIGVYKPRMDFHSFRHNASTVMYQNGASILEVDELTGHDSKHRKELKEAQSVSLHYLHGATLPRLREIIETIEYPSIDLKALREHGRRASDWPA